MSAREQWLTEAAARAAASHKSSAPISIMEIGVNQGERTRILLSQVAKRTAHPIHYYAFDLFQTWSPEIAKREGCRQSAPLSTASYQKFCAKPSVKYLRMIRGDVRETLLEMAPQLPKMDLICVSGPHSIETLNVVLPILLKIIRPAGILCLDGMYEDAAFGVKTFVDGWTRDDFQLEVADNFDTLPDQRVVRCVRITKKAE